MEASRTCRSGYELEADGLCYPICDDGTGEGALCVGSCPAGTSACGPLLCLGPDQQCTETIIDMTVTSLEAAASCGSQNYIACAFDLIEVVETFDYDVCPAEE